METNEDSNKRQDDQDHLLEESEHADLDASDRSNLDPSQLISAETIYEQRRKANEKQQRELDISGHKEAVALTPATYSSLANNHSNKTDENNKGQVSKTLAASTQDEEDSHQRNVQQYINSNLQERAQNPNFKRLDMAGFLEQNEEESAREAKEREKMMQQMNRMPRDRTRTPCAVPDLLARSDRTDLSGDSNISELADLDESQEITPMFIAQNRTKSLEAERQEADRAGSNGKWTASGYSSELNAPNRALSTPGAVRIGKDGPNTFSPVPKRGSVDSKFYSSGLSPVRVEAKLVEVDGDLDEIKVQENESYRLKVEEENTRLRRQLEEKEQSMKIPQDDTTVHSDTLITVVATAEEPQGLFAKRWFRTFSVLLALIAIGGIVAAVLLTRTGEADKHVVLSYPPPTQEECLVIANQTQIEGQHEMIVDRLDVVTEITLDSEDVDLVLLLPDLLDSMQKTLPLALTMCADADESSNTRSLRGGARALGSKGDPKYVIANANVDLEYKPDDSCVLPSASCHRVIVKLELFLKGPEYASTLMNIIYGVGQSNPLVDTLHLVSPYQLIEFTAINEGDVPTEPPTFQKYAYEPPSMEDCARVINGIDFPGQQDLIVSRLDVSTDVLVAANASVTDAATLLPDLARRMETKFPYALTGCSLLVGSDDQNRRFLGSEGNIRFVVANARVEVELAPGGSCNVPSSGTQECFPVVVKLTMYLKGFEYSSTVMQLIYDVGKNPSLLETLGYIDEDTSSIAQIDFTAINEA